MSDKTIALWVGGQVTEIKKGFWLSVKVIEGHLQKEDLLHRVLRIKSDRAENGTDQQPKLRVAEEFDVGILSVSRIQWLRKERKELAVGENGIILLEGDVQKLQQILEDETLKNLILASHSYSFQKPSADSTQA